MGPILPLRTATVGPGEKVCSAQTVAATMTTSPDDNNNADLAAATYMTPDEVLARLRTGFAPLRCVPELRDQGKYLDFRIFDQDQSLMRVEGTLTLHLCSPRGFRDITGTARQMLESHGYRLDSAE